MKIRRKIISILTTCYILVACATLSHGLASDFRIITGFLPPWSMNPASEYPGFFIEIINEAQKRMGTNIPVETIPWSRAQEIAQASENIIIFPLSRLANREGKYVWLNRIQPIDMVFVSYAKETITLEAAKKLNRILVHKNAPPETLLRANGFTNLVTVYDIKPSLPQMLKIGRADAWYTPKDMADWIWKLNPNMPLPTYSQHKTANDQYIAVSKKFDSEFREKLNATLNQMHKEGVIKQIMARYAPEQS